MKTPPQTMPDEPFGNNEPLFVFRASDELALEVLTFAAALYTKASSGQAANLLRDSAIEFAKWRENSMTLMPK